MKDWSTKKIIYFGLGVAFGMLLLDYFSKDSIDWGRSLFAGVFATVAALIIKKISKKRSTKQS